MKQQEGGIFNIQGKLNILKRWCTRFEGEEGDEGLGNIFLHVSPNRLDVITNKLPKQVTEARMEKQQTKHIFNGFQYLC